MRDYEPDIDRIMELYAQLEDDIVASMVKRILKMGFVSESTRYEAEILQAAGLLYEDIIALIAQRSGATEEAVKALFRDAGVQTVSIDNEAYREAGEVPIDIRQDEGMRQILEAGYRKTSGTMRNLVSTTATQTQNQFISACDRAYMQVSSGSFSYQQAIMQAVRGFADIGAMVQYPSGHRDHLDVAVRRAVLTGVGQTAAAIAKAHSEKVGCHLMELTAHSGSRPEHAAWQGQLVTLDGKDAGKTIDGLRVHTLNEIGYGTGAGFKGWNCRHNWHPYYVGYSTPNYTPEQLAALNEPSIEYNSQKYTEYQISQMQRAAERKIRKYKRRVVAEQTIMDNAPNDTIRATAEIRYQREASKLKAAEKELTDFCKQTGRYKDTFRTQVDGFSRSEAQRAVWANKKILTSTPNGGKIKSSKLGGSDIRSITGTMYAQSDADEFLNLLNSNPNQNIRRAYSQYSSQLRTVVFSKKNGDGSYQPSISKLVYSYPEQKHINNGKHKYSILAHEYGHFIDDKAIFSRLSFNEADKLNSCISTGISFFKQTPSQSDSFLSALREDKKVLSLIYSYPDIRDDLFSSDASAGVQDAICGMFGVKNSRMRWRHDEAYYDRQYKAIKSRGAEKSVQQVFKDLGFDVSNQAKVKALVRDYENASELWANIISAETCGGEELEYIKKYMPNSYAAFIDIMKGMI